MEDYSAVLDFAFLGLTILGCLLSFLAQTSSTAASLSDYRSLFRVMLIYCFLLSLYFGFKLYGKDKEIERLDKKEKVLTTLNKKLKQLNDKANAEIEQQLEVISNAQVITSQLKDSYEDNESINEKIKEQACICAKSIGSLKLNNEQTVHQIGRTRNLLDEFLMESDSASNFELFYYGDVLNDFETRTKNSNRIIVSLESQIRTIVDLAASKKAINVDQLKSIDALYKPTEPYLMPLDEY